MDKTIDPQRLTFNRKTLKTKVWKMRTDTPEFVAYTDAGGRALRTWTPTTIPREVFDMLPAGPAMLICNARQRSGVGWRQTAGRWHNFDIKQPRAAVRTTQHGGRPHRAPRARRPKASATRSSARSGDSGDDSDSSSDSSEPAPRRLCAFCGKDIPAERSPKATHCSDRHADRDRQRRKRARDRARSKLPVAPTTADFRRMLEITDEERDWLRALVVCRCNGRHLEFDPGECFRCGHTLPREQVAA